MKRGKPERLNWTARAGEFNAQYSIQDFYDLLVELVTNADDSYHNMFKHGLRAEDGGTILLEVERHKGAPSIITVADRAEGIDDLRRVVKDVGERTSQAGDRGFMGRGLKDCASLGNITIETIRDNFIQKAELNEHFDFIPWEPSSRSGDHPSKEDRARLGLPGRSNGTVVTVELRKDVRVPLRGSLESELPWHFALRDILAADGPSKLLFRAQGEDAVKVATEQPEGELVADEEYEIPGYGDARARFRLFRSPTPLSEGPAGDKRFRRSGVLVKGMRGIYECSFLTPDLDRDPAAENYFGRLDAPKIDDLINEFDERRVRREGHPPDNPRLVIDPNRRAGLVSLHPFTQALFQPPSQILRLQFDKEAQERKRSRTQVETKATTSRLRKLAKEAARFMHEKLADLDFASASDETESTTFTKKGVGIIPVFCQIPVGSERIFYVRADERLGLPIGTVIKVSLGKAAEQCVQLVGTPSDLAPDPMHEGILRGSFRLRGVSEGRRVQIECQVDGLEPIFSEVQVVPAGPIEVDIPGDFAFSRKTYSVKEGARRTLLVRARFSDPPAEAVPMLVRLSHPRVATLRTHTDLRLVPGTTYFEGSVVVQGKKLNASTEVLVEAEGRTARSTLTVVEKDEEGPDLDFKLVPHSLGQNYRASWDRKNPNLLLITTQHESISRYLGAQEDGFPGQNMEPFNVLAAELISDNICRRIAEERMRALPQEFSADRLYVLHNRLMREFTPIAHRVLLPHPRAVESPTEG